jgi:hypothetical protein
MQRGKGPAKFSGVSIGEVAVDLLGPAIYIKSTFAFVNADSPDQKFGRGQVDKDWSDETYKRFLSFLESMERDVCNLVFEEGASAEVQDTIKPDEQGDVPSL